MIDTIPYIWHAILIGGGLFMKKTTIYLKEDEFSLLRKKAFLTNQSLSELIRKGIRLICKPSSKKEEKMLKTLGDIRNMFERFSENDVSDLVQTAKKSVRSGNKSNR